ncbi:hypothetical protein D9V37_03425 [Nocardioides mangrovicus]|uniref:DUF2231 domain-containing protein n=1 Tax=Nocardioides mangrovicus TaxID=2478913 RepID=A0A3L8P7R7_9ACTN|nr:DUF2231 domain-containing protein [Nocardioides mangrovicus]RLV50992.1 hypothetical protein D9V37_03425 [Nocardioides mangrovicus]
MNFNGIPLHPLVVHAAVVLTPLAALLCLVFALVPRWRWAVRWPALVVSVLGFAAIYVAYLSGEDLEDRLNIRSEMFETHEEWAERLRLAMLVLAIVMVVAAFVLPFRSPLTSTGERAARLGVLSIPLVVLLVVGALFVAYAVYRTGDAGAHLVWDGTPT